MYEILEDLYKDKKILDHGSCSWKAISLCFKWWVIQQLDKELSEDDLYALELEAFMSLIQMPKTQERIKHTLENRETISKLKAFLIIIILIFLRGKIEQL